MAKAARGIRVVASLGENANWGLGCQRGRGGAVVTANVIWLWYYVYPGNLTGAASGLILTYYSPIIILERAAMFSRILLCIVFLSVWPTIAAAEQAPRGYERLNSPHKHAFRYSRTGEPIRRGNRSERFELRDGDCKGSDCRHGRLRSEIREPKRKSSARTNRDIWYGWSFRVAQSPRNPGKSGGLYPFLGQWKTGPDNSPTLSFMQSDHGTQDVVFVSLGDMSRRNNGIVAGHKNGNICKAIFSISSAKKGWIDIVMNTNFATDGSGYLKVWVNGKLKCKYSGQLVATKPSSGYSGPNHRRGIYVGNTKRWKSTYGTKPVPTWVVYYDEFLVGKTRGDVDTRLREKAGLPPKD